MALSSLLKNAGSHGGEDSGGLINQTGLPVLERDPAAWSRTYGIHVAPGSREGAEEGARDYFGLCVALKSSSSAALNISDHLLC